LNKFANEFIRRGMAKVAYQKPAIMRVFDWLGYHPGLDLESSRELLGKAVIRGVFGWKSFDSKYSAKFS